MDNKDVKGIIKIIKAMINEDDGLEKFMEKVNDGDDLIQIATSIIPYGGIDELCDNIDVDIDWFDFYFQFNEEIEDFEFLEDGGW